jgi:MFS transporter, AAHS family, 4-hydroxybenzoate transporter
MAGGTVDIIDVIERQRIGRFQITLYLLLFAATLADGYDALVMSYTAPLIVRAWHLERGALGPIFSISFVGLAIGAAIFGVLGDRLGRKRVMVASALLLGLVSLATMTASDPGTLFWYRFAAGLGIGGVFPNAIALVSEYSPRRRQATGVWVVLLGYQIGAASGFLVANGLAAVYGWQTMFLVGGIAPIVAALLALAFLVESVRFLALDPGRREATAAILQRMEPGLAIGPDTRLVLREEKLPGVPATHLFTEGRAALTVLLWIAFIGNLMTLQFLVNWVPTVLASPAISQAEANIASTMQQIGGMVGGLIVSRGIDRRGVLANALLFALGVPLVAAIGLGQESAGLAMVVLFAAGFCVIGGQTTLNAMAGRLYPTFMRSNGVGWALTMGRVGSVVGPYVGGILIGYGVPTTQLFYFAAVPTLCAALACFAMSWLPSAGAGATVNADAIGAE